MNMNSPVTSAVPSGTDLIIRPLATVFFDGSCPMCSREIKHYRNIRGSERIQWIDIAQEEHRLAAFNLTQQTAMARFHVLDGQYRWHTGAWGFIRMWSHLSYYRWLARIVTGLRLTAAIDRLYGYFSRWRLRRHCKDSSCRKISGEKLCVSAKVPPNN